MQSRPQGHQSISQVSGHRQSVSEPTVPLVKKHSIRPPFGLRMPASGPPHGKGTEVCVELGQVLLLACYAGGVRLKDRFVPVTLTSQISRLCCGLPLWTPFHRQQSHSPSSNKQTRYLGYFSSASKLEIDARLERDSIHVGERDLQPHRQTVQSEMFNCCSCTQTTGLPAVRGRTSGGRHGQIPDMCGLSKLDA